MSPQAGCGTDCTTSAAFAFLSCLTITLLRLPLSSPLYICFHSTLQIAGFNNVSLEVLLYAFGASIIEGQPCCSLLIMGVLVCLLLLVRCFMAMLSLWLLQDTQLFISDLSASPVALSSAHVGWAGFPLLHSSSNEKGQGRQLRHIPVLLVKRCCWSRVCGASLLC